MSSPKSEKAQRLRLRFARAPEAAAIGHLDLARIWERALLVAGVAVSYSRGNRPQARLTIAAGLPVGVTSQGELLDVVLAQRLRPAELAQRVGPHLPPGLAVLDAWEVGMGLPSLPSVVRWADYDVDVPVTDDGPEVAAAVASFLAAERFPWQDTRGERVRHYDLRPLVQEVRVLRAEPSASPRPEARAEGSVEPPQDEAEGRCGPTGAPGRGPVGARLGGDVVRLSMRLRCDAAGVGRPDQVVKALGLPQPSRIHRRRLVLAEVSPAHDAWRRRGRFLE